MSMQVTGSPYCLHGKGMCHHKTLLCEVVSKRVRILNSGAVMTRIIPARFENP